MMLRRMREAFGIDLYEHLSILVNYVPVSENTTAAHATFQREEQRWHKWVMQTEQRIFQWDKAKSTIMKQLVNQIPIYIADLDPIFWDIAFPVPLSAPFVAEIEPFSHPMGLHGVVNLIKDVQVA